MKVNRTTIALALCFVVLGVICLTNPLLYGVLSQLLDLVDRVSVLSSFVSLVFRSK